MKVDYRKSDGVRSGGSHVLTKAEQKEVDEAKKNKKDGVSINASGKKNKEKSVVEKPTVSDSDETKEININKDTED